MPIYEFKCTTCKEKMDEIHPMDAIPDSVSCLCGKSAVRIISPVMFSLKGEGWSGKDFKENSYRKKRYKEMGVRQTKTHSENTPQLIPNVDGERCDSWEDAAMLAKSKGKDTSGFKSKARKKLRV